MVLPQLPFSQQLVYAGLSISEPFRPSDDFISPALVALQNEWVAGRNRSSALLMRLVERYDFTPEQTNEMNALVCAHASASEVDAWFSSRLEYDLRGVVKVLTKNIDLLHANTRIDSFHKTKVFNKHVLGFSIALSYAFSGEVPSANMVKKFRHKVNWANVLKQSNNEEWQLDAVRRGDESIWSLALRKDVKLPKSVRSAAAARLGYKESISLKPFRSYAYQDPAHAGGWVDSDPLESWMILSNRARLIQTRERLFNTIVANQDRDYLLEALPLGYAFTEYSSNAWLVHVLLDVLGERLGDSPGLWSMFDSLVELDPTRRIPDLFEMLDVMFG